MLSSRVDHSVFAGVWEEPITLSEAWDLLNRENGASRFRSELDEGSTGTMSGDDSYDSRSYSHSSPGERPTLDELFSM